MFIRRAIAPLLTALTFLGCASQAQHLRSQPVMYMDITGDSNRMVEVLLPPIADVKTQPAVVTAANGEKRPAVAVASLDHDAITAASAVTVTPAPTTTTTRMMSAPTEQPAKLVIRCVRTPEFYNKDASTRGQCLYEAIDFQDVLNLPVRNQAERNRVVDVLASISERNCHKFRDRVFANKAVLDATKNTGKDIATGLAASTVKFASGFSAGIGIFNLIGGSAVTNINQVIFSDKTFDVISAAIDAERAKWKTTLNLNRRLKFEEYSYQAALDDFQSYDLTCSLGAALDHLGALAEDDRKTQTAALTATRGNELDQLHQEVDNLRKQRDADQDLLKQAQKKLLDATDQGEREALEAQIKDLREQVSASTSAVHTLQSSIHSATTPTEAPQVTPPVVPKTTTPPAPTPKEN